MSTTENIADPTTAAIEQLAAIVVGTAAFQEAVQQYDPEAAREHLYKSFYRVEDQELLAPFAVIFELPGASWERRSDTTVLPRGELFLHLGLPMNDPADNEGEERRFNNWHGQIAQAIAKYDGAGYVMQTTITDPPRRTTPQNAGAVKPFWDIGYTVSWGPF